MSKLAEIEALLFVAGEDGLKVHQLAEILSLPPTGVIQSLEKLAEQYEANPDSSRSLQRFCGPIRGRQSIKVCRGRPWRPCLSLPINSRLQGWK